MQFFLSNYFNDKDFILLRENPDFANLPFISMPNYLAKLDGRGLNPLLMNYHTLIKN